ncbi:hypothetical protein OS176_09610 [Xanthomonadaceae bacterium XH05]|nr:hypothetical protein [Xanthomonadaceae bacterium XH05]
MRKQPNGGAAVTARKSPGRNGYRYRQQYGIVVVLPDEAAQAKAYNDLKRAGFQKLKVVTV